MLTTIITIIIMSIMMMMMIIIIIIIIIITITVKFYGSALPNKQNTYTKVEHRNTRTRCEICSKLTIITPNDDVLASLLWASNIFPTFF